ncbi:MAG: histidinol-phosphate transaminase [bacterium]
MTERSDSPSDSIAALVRAEIRAMQAYQVAPSAGLIKLDAMESPHRLPCELKQSWLARLGEVEVNRYPDSTCAALKDALRDAFGIDSAHGVVLGNGSDELIQMIALLVGGRGRVLLAPTPSFSMYRLIAAATATEFVAVPLRDDFQLDADAMRDAVRRHQPACVFLAYPNNPSGNCFDEAAIESVLREAPGLVVLDEAYFAFCRRSFLARLKAFPNLLVLRTLSKSGMAALRLGILIGHRDWTEQLEKLRLPYNINSLTQCSAVFYLEHREIIAQHAERIVQQRGEVFAQLSELREVHAYPSDTNFILLRLRDGDATRVHQRLQARGVLVKNLHRADTPLSDCLRVTIGDADDNRAFIAALRASLRE